MYLLKVSIAGPGRWVGRGWNSSETQIKLRDANDRTFQEKLCPAGL